MSELHVFEIGDSEWVIAESIDDAWAAYKDTTGMTPSEFAAEYDEGASECIRQLPDDAVMPIRCYADGRIMEDGDSEGTTVVKLPCAEWAKREGRGYFVTTEY